MQAFRIVIACALAAGCGGGGSGQAPAKAGSSTAAAGAAAAGSAAGAAGGAGCAPAVEHLFAVTSAAEEPKVRKVALDVFVRRCEADRWSEPIRQCLLEVKAPTDADRCERMLTQEQQTELRTELTKELDAAGVPPQRESGKPKAK
jgi:hypothetical protein